MGAFDIFHSLAKDLPHREGAAEGQADAAHADGHNGGNFEQAEADGPDVGVLELGAFKTHAA